MFLKHLRFHSFELCEAVIALEAHVLENKDMTASELSSLSVLVSVKPFIISVI